MRCEGCHAEPVVLFSPEASLVWGVCLDCAVGGDIGKDLILERLAQANCGAAFERGRLLSMEVRS